MNIYQLYLHFVSLYFDWSSGGNTAWLEYLPFFFFKFFFFCTFFFALLLSYCKNPVYSIFCLIIIAINCSCILLLLNIEFLGLVLIIVYVGAIAILFLYIIMLLNIKRIISKEVYYVSIPYYLIIFETFFILQFDNFLRIFLYKYNIFPNYYLIISQSVFLRWEYTWVNVIDNNLKQPFFLCGCNLSEFFIDDLFVIGSLLYTEFYLHFFFLGFILLLAMLGAIAIVLQVFEVRK